MLKEDVFKKMAVDALVDVVSYVDEDKVAELKEAAKKAKAAKAAARAKAAQISPEEGAEQGNPDFTSSVRA